MKSKGKQILIGTSGWNYAHWVGKFYPTKLKSYEDLKFYAERYNTVENNSSFYRIASPPTYKKWFKATPDDFIFSLKLNKIFTHSYRLKMDGDTPEETAVRQEKLFTILDDLQVLENKLGCLLMQMPPSFKFDAERVESFLKLITKQIKKLKYQPDLAFEFRHPTWFTKEAYAILKRYNVALVMAQSSRYPLDRAVTADFLYIRFHGPKQLFASPYSDAEMQDWWQFLNKAKKIKRVYIYFNNDIGGYALDNSQYLQKLSSASK
jgi:uncharacterized protein YecE (DUF72 family)